MPVAIPNNNIAYFCELPWNYDSKTYKTNTTTPAPKLTDGRTDTFEGPGTYIVANATAIATTHLYIVASGVTQFTITGTPSGDDTDGSPYTITDANYTVTKSNNLETKYTWGGLSHYLFKTNRSSGLVGWNATQISIAVTGSSARVYQIAAMKYILTLDMNENRFATFDFESREPRATRYTNLRGRSSKALLVGEPIRYDFHTNVVFRNTDTMTNSSAEDFDHFFHANPNFAFIPNYSWFPDKVFTRAIVAQETLRRLRLGTQLARYDVPMIIRQVQ